MNLLKEQNLIAFLLNVHNLKNRIKYYFQVQLLKCKKFKQIFFVKSAKFIIYIKFVHTATNDFVVNKKLSSNIHMTSVLKKREQSGHSVTSQIFNLECYTQIIIAQHILLHFGKSSINPKQLKDPRRELGIFPIYHI